MMPWIRKNRLVDTSKTREPIAHIDHRLSPAAGRLQPRAVKNIGAQPKKTIDNVTN